MRSRLVLSVLLLLHAFFILAQSTIIEGEVKGADDEQGIEGALVYLEQNTSIQTTTGKGGKYKLVIEKDGSYTLVVNMLSYVKASVPIEAHGQTQTINVRIQPMVNNLDQVTIEREKPHKTFGVTRLEGVEGTNINEGKKNEVVVMNDLSANLSTNNPRQLFCKVPGINVWESDGAGIQLGIGGRGLSPNRSANFNVRQNGYDISADALGYPESYYTPPTEALDRIELIRGAASLQYGTQFGGMLNFVMRQGPKKKPFELTMRNTLGSWGFWNTFTSVGGTKGNVNYYAFFQHKQGNGWRTNSDFNQQTAYAGLTWSVNKKIDLTFNYTYMGYLAHQAGGLTDKMYAANARQSVRDRNWFKVNWNLPSLSLNYKISENTTFNIRSFALLAGRDAIGNLDDVSKKDELTDRLLLKDAYVNVGAEARLLHKYSLASMKNVVLLGARAYRGTTYRKQGYGNNGSDASFSYLDESNPELSSHTFVGKNAAVFLENIFYICKKWSITPGIRYESIRTSIDGYFNERVFNLAGNLVAEQKNLQIEERPRDFLLTGIGVSFKLDSSTEFYGNATQNYRAVTYSDVAVFNPSVQIDPNLKDERGYSTEIGVRGHKDYVFNYDIGVFHMGYNDRIGTRLNTQNKRFRTNIADASIYGIEAYTELDVIHLFNKNVKTSLSLFSNLALISAQYRTDEKQYDGKKVELVPNVNWRSGISIRKGYFSGAITHSFIGKQYTDATNAEKPNSSAVIGTIPQYRVFDLSFKYIYHRFTFEASCNNLLNTKYFTRRADGYPGPGILPADGRGFFFTLGVKI